VKDKIGKSTRNNGQGTWKTAKAFSQLRNQNVKNCEEFWRINIRRFPISLRDLSQALARLPMGETLHM
jgi:hypothetical protein